MRKSVLEKVVIYVTRGDEILVFGHTHYSEAGIQVPAGTVRLGEDLVDAAIREVNEETGLDVDDLELRAKLGVDVFPSGDTDVSPSVRRHFFHLEFVGDSPQKWIHYERDPSDGTPGPIEFELKWVKNPDEIPVLAGNQGAMLSKLNIAR
jgi:8-oxo-dGTP pyrophosphatase MutT (NUDIX family)